MLKGKLVILAVVVLVLSMTLLGASDSKVSVAGMGATDAGISEAQLAEEETEAEYPPASSSATITITWTTAPGG